MANKRRCDSLDGSMVHVRDNIYKKPYRRQNGLPGNTYYALIKCEICQKPYYRDLNNHNRGGRPVCSQECKNKLMRSPTGSKKFKRGNGHGYILIKNPTHPEARKGYVPEHRLVMEQKIGRLLKNNEYIHHINCDVQDNREENLIIVNRWNHNTIHKFEKHVKSLMEIGVLVFDKNNLEYKVVK